MKASMHLVYQGLLAIIQFANIFSTKVPITYQKYVAAIVTLAMGGMGIYNHFYTPDGSKIVR